MTSSAPPAAASRSPEARRARSGQAARTATPIPAATVAAKANRIRAESVVMRAGSGAAGCYRVTPLPRPAGFWRPVPAADASAELRAAALDRVRLRDADDMEAGVDVQHLAGAAMAEIGEQIERG